MGDSSITFTPSQKQRLIELGAELSKLEASFTSPREREKVFNSLAEKLTRKNRETIKKLKDSGKRPPLKTVESKLVNVLTSLGFVEVVTPTIIPKTFISRMGIEKESNLWQQILWLDGRRCLRPMLAPNLYFVMGKLRRFWKPVRIFEVGSCFRKDTRGSFHTEEFTMLNFVELAPDANPRERLAELIAKTMGGLGIGSYEVRSESSEVYGETLDVLVKDVEIGSAAIGPKPMDVNWGIVDPWVGLGLGIERVAMVTGNHHPIARVSRSLIYLNGARLDIK
ncbi:pyrrolysine--tRNA(Pyl) ligase large subunit [Candidatus Hecatella orcuttiae]|jgi:phenylalanyl-tRNA synthetase alpha chain|uniref:pyrrolysine--tRNA(Pyl) ligase large subunit n=1 Tax=Candidatus Hecatella orcuttiae TaxID=1935119 RepID=UPI0028680635|nr:pyrrolysine--tRNA(Pyl) ligase large subunit [Candidatus Hecatella orcuttiae]